MDKKYFFFDIDGTLTDPVTGQAAEDSVQVLHELKKRGHFVAIATGRAHYKARVFAEKVGIADMVCCGGGGLVVNGRLIENIPLPSEQAKAFLKHAEETGKGFLLMLEDNDKCFMKDTLFLEQAGLRKELTTYILNPELDYETLPEILKIYLPLKKEEQYPWLELLGYLRMTPDYIVCQYDAKKDGIIRMMNLLGGDLKDIVVFGDDTNDLVMFDPQWISIAMGNGTKELKEKADYVTASSVNKGIRKACEHFGWL